MSDPIRMTDTDRVNYLRSELEKIRDLTFDECWDEHRYNFDRCRKQEARDWAKVQSTAARALRNTEP